MESPAAYLPIDRQLALCRGQDLPEQTHGAALFADISGFTPLTELLAQKWGPQRGAEELTRYLNRVYDVLIAELDRYGGSVLGFSGDGITCWFEGDDGRHATTTALAMQQAMRQFAELQISEGEDGRPGEQVTLAMKAAVAVGPARRFVAGDPDYLVLDVLAGVTLERLAMAEQQAYSGDVVLSQEVVATLSPHLEIRRWRTDAASGRRFAVVDALSMPVAERPWPRPEVDLSNEQVKPWLLPAVYHRLVRGQGEFLAELRPVATLFLRFTGLDYDNDPAAPQKLDTFVRQVEHVLQRYNGSLLQLTMGDKGSYLYAAFGAPLAHEDDMDRAAEAALELLTLPRELPFLEPLQIGLAYGRARVGAYGSESRRTYGVLGDATNLAARLMQAARPGEILASQEASRRTSSRFVWEQLPPLPVKGKSEPVAVSRLQRRRQRRSGMTLNDLFPLPPVGRQAIWQRLEECLNKLVAGPAGQIIRLAGEAGLGKSHLAVHFGRQAQAQQAQLAVGVCQSVTQNTPYHPWRQIFYSLLDLQEVEEAAAVSHLETLLSSAHPEWAVRLPLLGDLLALPIPDNPTTAALDTDLRQKTLFSLLVEMVQVWARHQPLVLILENAHWMDEASVALLETLARQATPSVPLLLLLVQRPPRQDEAAWLPQLTEFPHYSEVLLEGLDFHEVAELMERHLGGRPSLLLLEIVHRLTHGNPLFVGEMLATMKQAQQIVYREDMAFWGVSSALITLLQQAGLIIQSDGQWQLRPGADLERVTLGVPDSIHGLLLSRLDRLPETHKTTLKVDSVLGQVVDLELVKQVHPEAKSPGEVTAETEYLATEGILYPVGSTEKQYAFRQPMTQEVAYETLLHEQRQQLHRRVAEAVSAAQPEAVTTIAHHAYMGQLWPLALTYNLAAGEQAKQLFANQQGIVFLRRALACAAELPAEETVAARQRAHLALGELLVSAGQHEAAESHLDEALQLAQALQDREAEAACYRWLGRSRELRGEYAAALEWLDKGFAALNGMPSAAEAELALIAGLIYVRQGQFKLALALGERGLHVGEALNDAAIQARAYNLLGIIELRGHSASAIDRFQQALRQYEQLGNLNGQAISHNLMANGYFAQSQWPAADEHYRRSLDLFTQLGNVYNQAQVSNNLGGIALKQGRLDAALDYYRRSLDLLEQIGGSLWVLGALRLNIGHVHLRRGEIDLALTSLSQAQETLAKAQTRDLLPELYGLLAEATWLQGDLDTAEQHGRQALELARELSMPREEGHNLRIWGEIAFTRQRLEVAEQAFQESYTMLTTAGDEYEAAQSRLSLAHLYAAQDRPEAAQEALQAAGAVFEKLGAQLDLERTRRLQDALAQKA